MDESQKKELIQHRILKSKETIEEAKLSYQNKRYRLALNRVYYSIFYIISALSVKYNYSTSKHKQLMGWFTFNFVKTGIVSNQLYNTYKEAFDNRQESDYSDFIEYDETDIPRLINEAEQFVVEIEKLILT